MSRRVYLLGVCVALVALAFAVTDWVLGPQPGVTEANFKRIRPGMTMTEVKATLGGAGQRVVTITEGGTDITDFRWTGLGAEAHVLFIQVGADRPPYVHQPATFRRTAGPSPLARLRAWLGW